MKALTLTIIANMTSNYSEGLGNISSIQKVYRNQDVYAIRSRESLKNALMVQSGLYNDLQTSVDGAAQKFVSADVNAATCRALEGGYMNTKVASPSGGKDTSTYVRKSSFYLTDAIATDSLVNDTRFHNNLYLASTEAKQKGLNVQNDAGKIGLMPYQYEYDKSYKIYSITVDLEQWGKDDNFDAEASNEEKCDRLIALLNAIQNLHLVVKGNLDNAEPIFVVGGIGARKTHYFENVVRLNKRSLEITEDLKDRLKQGYSCGMIQGDILSNEKDIEVYLKPISVTTFFAALEADVKKYFNV